MNKTFIKYFSVQAAFVLFGITPLVCMEEGPSQERVMPGWEEPFVFEEGDALALANPWLANDTLVEDGGAEEEGEVSDEILSGENSSDEDYEPSGEAFFIPNDIVFVISTFLQAEDILFGIAKVCARWRQVVYTDVADIVTLHDSKVLCDNWSQKYFLKRLELLKKFKKISFDYTVNCVDSNRFTFQELDGKRSVFHYFVTGLDERLQELKLRAFRLIMLPELPRSVKKLKIVPDRMWLNWFPFQRDQKKLGQRLRRNLEGIRVLSLKTGSTTELYHILLASLPLDLEEFVANCRNTGPITLPGRVRELSRLKKLTLKRCSASDKFLEALAGNKDLQSLRVVQTKYFSGEALRYMPSTICVVDFSRTTIEEAFLAPFISRLCKLVSLNLALGPEISDCVVAAISPSIKKVNFELGPSFRRYGKLTAQGLTRAFKSWVHLKKLILKNCCVVKSDVVAALQPSLVDLDLSGCADLDDVAVAQIPQRLVVLHLDRCPRITDQIVGALLSHPYLSVLTIDDCEQASPEMYERVLQIFDPQRYKHIFCMDFSGKN